MIKLANLRYLIQIILVVLGYLLGWLVSSMFSFDEMWSNLSKIAGAVLLPLVYLAIPSKKLSGR